MILVDSSIWIDHFRRANPLLIEAAMSQRILQHPFVTIELALGSIPQRDTAVGKLFDLPQAAVVEETELLAFIDNHSLHGSGIGLVDANLLASSAQAAGTNLWTRDKRLAKQAERLGLAYRP